MTSNLLNSPKTLFSGWVLKEGKIRHSWRKRFFVLQGGTLFGRIDYFVEENRSWRGAISLAKAEPAETIDDPLPRRKQPLYCLALRTPTRAWLFGTCTEIERSQWINLINIVISHLHSSSSSPSANSTTSNPFILPNQQILQEQQKQEEQQILPPHPNSIAPSPPEYVFLTDPEGDRTRLLELCLRIPGFQEREKALQRSSRDLTARGRLIIEPSSKDGSDVLSGLSDSSDEDSPATATSDGKKEAPSSEQQKPNSNEMVIEIVEEVSKIYEEWGNELLNYATDLIQAQEDVSNSKGFPCVSFYDKQSNVHRDVKFLLLVFSEAWEKIIGGIDRQKRPKREVINKLRKLLTSWSSLLLNLSSISSAQLIASASTNRRIGSESPLKLLTPELSRRVIMWTIPSLISSSATTTFSNGTTNMLDRTILAQQSSEKNFLLRHLGRLIYRGPVRFGFISVCLPASDGDNFAKIAGRNQQISTNNQQQQQGEIPEGRLFCELIHDSLCFTDSNCIEVAVPLLWIRKLEIEMTAGCFMKFTRYLSHPSPEAQLESRILYADNAHETFAWLSDITRAFMQRRKHENTQ